MVHEGAVRRRPVERVQVSSSATQHTPRARGPEAHQLTSVSTNEMTNGAAGVLALEENGPHGLHLEAELFAQLAPRTIKPRLPGVQLSSGEFPETAMAFPQGAAGE